MSVDVQLDGAQKLDKALRMVQRATGRESYRMVATASWAFARSAKKATGKGRKNRKQEVAPNGRRGYMIMKQDGKHRWVYLPSTQDVDQANKRDAIIAKYRQIKRQGFAKNSWLKAEFDLGKGSGVIPNRSIINKFVDVQKELRGHSPYVEITNDVSYIGKRHPEILNTAMKKAALTIIGSWDKDVASKIKREWEEAVALMGLDYTKLTEQAFLQALSGVTGLTFRAYHVNDEGSAVEDIKYPLCEIVANPEQEMQMLAVLFSLDIAVAVATYYDDDTKRETLASKSNEVFDLLTPDNIDTAMGTIGASTLGVQGVTYSDNGTTQDANDQRQTRVYTVHLYDAS